MISLLFDAFRRTNSKTEQSKIDGSNVLEIQRNRPFQKLLDKKQQSSKFGFKGKKEDDYKIISKKR